MKKTNEILIQAKKAVFDLRGISSKIKNEALLTMADALEKNSAQILKANEIDVENAKNALSDVMIDRLMLNGARITAMANGIRKVASLKDPVGAVLENSVLDNGLKLSKISVPIGVLGIIYESRPNVTSDAGALSFKSGNVCVLRGGKEAFTTSKVIVEIMRSTLKEMGLNENFINVIEDTSRQSATELMEAVGFIDALIPRGGAGLIRSCVENAKVPCIQTGTGICHVYVDEYADFEKALNIIENAKTSRPSVCNAEEVLLLHKSIYKEFLPLVNDRLVAQRTAMGLKAVELRLDERAHAVLGGIRATKDDFNTEFLDYVLAVKVVDGISDAIMHVSNHSTGHSDAIVTENKENANLFTLMVDSAAVYVNASTRFTDGGEFGKGCEIGISTQKLHARGPMGLEELTSYKYVVIGDGQIR